MKNLLLLLIILSCFSVTAQKKKGSGITIHNLTVIDRPAIEWTNLKADTSTVATNIQSYSFRLRSRVPLTKLEIKVNGVVADVYNKNDFSAPDSNGDYNQLIAGTLTLRTGMNTIVAVATNDKAVITESTRRINVDPNQITVLRNEKDRTPPMIYISNPANIREDRVIAYEDLIRMTGTVIDESGIQSLKINNIVTPVKENGAFIINLPINIGENAITVEVKDLNQNIALKKFVIERRSLDGTEYNPTKAKNYLIVIGVDQYSTWPMLNNAVGDAKAITKVLTTDYTFDPENVTVLLDEQATRQNIYRVLRAHIEKITPSDNLMIYYSGHGYFDKLLNEGYWVPIDGGSGSDVSSYIPNSQILKILENVNSQHTFLVADACFSGSLFASSSRGYTEQVEKYKSRWGLTSGRLEFVSDGNKGQNSPFATSVLDFLTNSKDAKVPVSDLVQYVKKKVSEVNDQTPIGNPLKGIGDEGGEFVFYRRQ